MKLCNFIEIIAEARYASSIPWLVDPRLYQPQQYSVERAREFTKWVFENIETLNKVYEELVERAQEEIQSWGNLDWAENMYRAQGGVKHMFDASLVPSTKSTSQLRKHPTPDFRDFIAMAEHMIEKYIYNQFADEPIREPNKF